MRKPSLGSMIKRMFTLLLPTSKYPQPAGGFKIYQTPSLPEVKFKPKRKRRRNCFRKRLSSFSDDDFNFIQARRATQRTYSSRYTTMQKAAHDSRATLRTHSAMFPGFEMVDSQPSLRKPDTEREPITPLLPPIVLPLQSPQQPKSNSVKEGNGIQGEERAPQTEAPKKQETPLPQIGASSTRRSGKRGVPLSGISNPRPGWYANLALQQPGLPEVKATNGYSQHPAHPIPKRLPPITLPSMPISVAPSEGLEVPFKLVLDCPSIPPTPSLVCAPTVPPVDALVIQPRETVSLLPDQLVVCWGCEDSNAKADRVTGICRECESYFIPCLNWSADKVMDTSRSSSRVAEGGEEAQAIAGNRDTKPKVLQANYLKLGSDSHEREDSPTLGRYNPHMQRFPESSSSSINLQPPATQYLAPGFPSGLGIGPGDGYTPRSHFSKDTIVFFNDSPGASLDHFTYDRYGDWRDSFSSTVTSSSEGSTNNSLPHPQYLTVQTVPKITAELKCVPTMSTAKHMRAPMSDKGALEVPTSSYDKSSFSPGPSAASHKGVLSGSGWVHPEQRSGFVPSSWLNLDEPPELEVPMWPEFWDHDDNDSSSGWSYHLNSSFE